MGWLIDPDQQSVLVYQPDQSTTIYDQPITRLPVPEFAQDVNLTVEDLFSWLLE